MTRLTTMLMLLSGCTSNSPFVHPDLSGTAPITASLELDGGLPLDGAADLEEATEGGTAALAANQTALDFGKVLAGTASGPLSVMVSNAGYPSLISSVTVTGGGFVLAEESCIGHTLDGSTTCSAAVRFDPAAAGSASGTLTVEGSSGGAVSISLGGLGVAPGVMGFVPDTFSFGSVVAGASTGTTASPDGRFALVNTGLVNTGPITATLSGGGTNMLWIVANNCSGGLAPGTSCAVSVRFQAVVAASGATTATLTATDEQGGSATASLSASVP